MQESTMKETLLGVRDESKIWRALLQSGAESVAKNASISVSTSSSPIEFAPVELVEDERAPLTKEEYQTLMAPLWDYGARKRREFTRSEGLPDRFFNRLLERVAASGKRLPDLFLYNFADATRDKKFSTLSLSTLYSRLGRWLKEKEPTGDFRDLTPFLFPPELLKSSPDAGEATRVWRELSSEESESSLEDRLAVFEIIRARAPLQGTKLIQENWGKLKLAGLDSYLNALRDGLSENDLEFLQDWEWRLPKWSGYFDALSVLHDLLVNFPTSIYAQRTLEDAELLLSNFDILDKLTETKKEKEEGEQEPEKIDDRDIFLTLGRVPLARWEEFLSSTPKEIYELCRKSPKSALLTQARLLSFALFGASDEWFEVCCDLFPGVYALVKKRREKRLVCAVKGLEPFQVDERFLKRALETGRVDYFKRLLEIWNVKAKTPGDRFQFEIRVLQSALRYCPYPWSEELARAFCETLIEHIRSDEPEVVLRARELFLPVVGYCPRAIRKEICKFATNGVDEFKPDEDFTKACLDVCAWRDRFDRLFGSPEEELPTPRKVGKIKKSGNKKKIR